MTQKKIQKNNKLLVITDGYPEPRRNMYKSQFVYEYVELARILFKEVIVISPQPFLPKYFLTLKMFKGLKNITGYQNYIYKNVKVFYPYFPTIPLEVFRRINGVLASLASILLLFRERIKFDLVHSHYIYPPGFIGMVLKKIFRTSLIITCHGGDLYSNPFKNSSCLKRAHKILRAANRITLPSSQMKKYIRRIDKSLIPKTKVIHNFVNTNRFSPLKKRPKKKLYLLNVSNFTPSKGHKDLIQIAKILSNKNVDFKLILIGEGPLYTKIKNEVEKFALKDKVSMLGRIENKNLPKYYNNSDVFLFPSYRESFGVVIIESLACGTPVISYKNEGAREIIKNKDLGILVEIGDKKEFAKKIIKASQKEWSSGKMSNYIQNNFSYKSQVRALSSIYNQG